MMDREAFGPSDHTLKFYFDAIEHAGSTEARLVVTHLDPIPCFDVDITHNSYEQNALCDSCRSTDFSTSSTSATTAKVRSDSTHVGQCGEKEMVIVFDSSPLWDALTISSASLKLYIDGTLSDNTGYLRLRVHTKQRSGSCPTSAGPVDFVGCASGFTALTPTITNATGAVTFTIPNPNTYINKTGLTEFVLVDTSEFTDADAYCEWTISTAENASSSRRPRLVVNY